MTGGKRDCRCPKAKHKHGTRAAYTKDGCRCFPCRVEHSRILARGTAGGGWADEGMYAPRCSVVRRLEALHAIGWSEGDIGQRIGMTKQGVHDLRTHSSDVVLTVTAAKIAAVYDELWDKQNPGPYRNRTVNWAKRRGFLPPLAYDDDELDNPNAQPHNTPPPSRWASAADRDGPIDEIAVEEAMRGRPVTLTRTERLEAIRRLNHLGLSDTRIAERLGMTEANAGNTRRRRVAAPTSPSTEAAA